ncbi:MAG: hypothetical protein V4472_25630 [Pseudomonadota bacterium]
MGKASTMKARRRLHPHQTTADIEVVCPGMLEILSVGKGDIKLTVGGSDPVEVEKAKTIIEEMIRKGYGLFVETPKGLARVKRFNPKAMEYVITDVVYDAPPELSAPTKPGRRVVEKKVPLAGSRAKAIGRTAGG